MLRLMDNLRSQAQRQKVDRKEKVSLNQLKMDEALLKINENVGRRHIEAVDNRINQIRDSSSKELLQMKWLDFLALKIDNFAEAPVPPRTIAPRSRSLNRKPERLGNLQRTWTRVQSVDREKMDDDDPTLSFIRWPRGGQSVLTKSGSPLAVPQPLEEHCATDKVTPTRKPPKMMDQMNQREILMNLDQNTLA